jgi:hypothetical protein
MSWERDPLWAKSRLFFERAFSESREDPLFGLWCSLGLELLARAALASISPTLLAADAPDHKFLLHALNRGSKRVPRRSIATNQVFELCRMLFDQFSKDDLAAATALVNRRNDELHTGAAAFEEYPSKLWLPGFYRACQALATAMNESLESLFGPEEAEVAAEILKETQNEVRQRVQSTVAAHRKVFETKSKEDKQTEADTAKGEADRLAHLRHHRVICPACGCDATVQGEPFGTEHVSYGDNNSITVRQAVSPRSFSCSACGLKLQGYGELDAAQLGGQYTRRTEFSPEEFYGLIDPETADLQPYVESYLADIANEYDNE